MPRDGDSGVFFLSGLKSFSPTQKCRYAKKFAYYAGAMVLLLDDNSEYVAHIHTWENVFSDKENPICYCF